MRGAAKTASPRAFPAPVRECRSLEVPSRGGGRGAGGASEAPSLTSRSCARLWGREALELEVDEPAAYIQKEMQVHFVVLTGRQ